MMSGSTDSPTTAFTAEGSGKDAEALIAATDHTAAFLIGCRLTLSGRLSETSGHISMIFRSWTNRRDPAPPRASIIRDEHTFII
jgi:hypothetical protein